MKQTEIDSITNRLKVLNEAKVDSINRDHGDIWICFIDGTGINYILVMQTLFRFCDAEKVLITEMDKYKASDFVLSSPLYNEENFDWDVKGLNKFDEWVQDNQYSLLSKLLVKGVLINIYGDLTIAFNEGITLTVYLEVTNNTECWRFFEKEADEKDDLVLLGSGLRE